MFDFHSSLAKFLNRKTNHKVLTTDWYGSDSKKKFVENLKIDYTKLEAYIKNPIKYVWNKDGFRSDFEYRPQKNLEVDIYLGCSHTLGTGHHTENTWPYHVSQITGNRAINLGQGGTGTEISFINLSKYIKFFKVVNVFHFQPVYARYTFPFKGQIGNVLIQNVDLETGEEDYVPWKKKHIKEELIRDDTIAYYHFKHIMAIQGICNAYNVPYFHFTGDRGLPPSKVPTLKEVDKDTVARDLEHFTCKQQKNIADNFINMLTFNTKGYNEMNTQWTKTNLI